MTLDILRRLYKRDLEKLKVEIESYKSEKNIWIVDKAINNSGGNLCLHLIGNLNHFLGAVLGSTGYVRNRDLEFSAKNVPQSKLVQQVIDTISVVDKVLAQLPVEKLSDDYPLEVFNQKDSIQYILTHLAAHLSYHLGQINYHRRLLDH